MHRSGQSPCLEEIALDRNWIRPDDVAARAATLRNSDYGAYLQRVLKEREMGH